MRRAREVPARKALRDPGNDIVSRQHVLDRNLSRADRHVGHQQGPPGEGSNRKECARAAQSGLRSGTKGNEL